MLALVAFAASAYLQTKGYKGHNVNFMVFTGADPCRVRSRTLQPAPPHAARQRVRMQRVLGVSRAYR